MPRVTLIALALSPAFPGIAFTRGGGRSVLHICITNRNQPRFVAPTESCHRGEIAAHWPKAPAGTPALPDVVGAGGKVIGETVRYGPADATVVLSVHGAARCWRASGFAWRGDEERGYR